MIWSLSCQTDVQIIKVLPNTSDYTKFKSYAFSCYARFCKRWGRPTKLIEVNVTGAQNSESARMIANIVGSSLVKTAILAKILIEEELLLQQDTQTQLSILIK